MASTQYVYTMHKLGKAWPGGKEVLKDISLSFLPGAKIGVLGLNGAGKSTLLKIMAGIETEFSGEAWPADGINIGYLAQEPELDETMDVAGNVLSGMGQAKELVDRFNEVSARFAEEMSDEEMNATIAEQAELQDQIDAIDGWDLERKAEIPIEYHPDIRSAEACYLSSSKAIALAKETGARLHVFHLSTARETALFQNDVPLAEKQITSEVCIHHLWFSDEDYTKKGTHIKWNPAVKSAVDRAGLWEALNDDRIDIIATDHAPHTLEEKNQVYTKAPSGGPMVQHALAVMLECVNQGKISLEKVVEKMCHNPAILFSIKERGYIRAGYYADLVLVDANQAHTITRDSLLYKCGWSPLEGTTLRGAVTHTFLNGALMYENGNIKEAHHAKPLSFTR
mgnify:CR=1 FL=1